MRLTVSVRRILFTAIFFIGSQESDLFKNFGIGFNSFHMAAAQKNCSAHSIQKMHVLFGAN